MINHDQLPPIDPADRSPPRLRPEVAGGAIPGRPPGEQFTRPDGGKEFKTYFDNGNPRCEVSLNPDGSSRLTTRWPNGQIFFDQTREIDGSLDYKSYHECGCPWFDQVRDSKGKRTGTTHSPSEDHSCNSQAEASPDSWADTR